MNRKLNKNYLVASGLCCVLAASGVVAVGANGAEAAAKGNNKTVICHATGQGYVAVATADGGRSHRKHLNDVAPLAGGGCPEFAITLPDGAAASGSGVSNADGASIGASSGEDSTDGAFTGRQNYVNGGNASGPIAKGASLSNGTGSVSGSTVPTSQVDTTVPNGTAPVATPEPVTMLLFGAGLAGVGFISRRRKKADQ